MENGKWRMENGEWKMPQRSESNDKLANHCQASKAS